MVARIESGPCSLIGGKNSYESTALPCDFKKSSWATAPNRYHIKEWVLCEVIGEVITNLRTTPTFSFSTLFQKPCGLW